MNSPITIEDVKRWLRSYGEQVSDIQSQTERIEQLRSRLEAPRTATWTGLPGGGGDRADRLGVELGRIEELENELAENRAAARMLYKQIDGTITQIHGSAWPDKRFVLRARYLDGCKWPEISEMLFCRKTDYGGKEDAYMRRTFTIHKAALMDLLEIYNELLKGSENYETE